MGLLGFLAPFMGRCLVAQAFMPVRVSLIYGRNDDQGPRRPNRVRHSSGCDKNGLLYRVYGCVRVVLYS